MEKENPSFFEEISFYLGYGNNWLDNTDKMLQFEDYKTTATNKPTNFDVGDQPFSGLRGMIRDLLLARLCLSEPQKTVGDKS